MRSVNPGEVWMIDFGIAAKVRPALILTGVFRKISCFRSRAENSTL
jgi:hypothetical protein